GDGDLDLFVSSIFDNDCPEGDQCFWGTTGNRLFRNEGNRRFVDVTEAQGLLDGGWAWGTRFFDYDLDGDLDLIQVNGTRGAWPETGFDNENLRLFRNDGDRFSEVALELGLIDRGIGRAVVPFDADRDGDLDLLITHNMGSPHFWRNEAAEGRSWLRVKPQGTISNRDGMGAVVRVWTRAGAPPMVRHAGNGCGFLGQSEGTPHFGLGDVERVHRVEVYWPATDQRQAFENVDARQELLVIEPRL
ncbi:MAG: FG-GAP-like repeat-containing protein, partial [Myxococcota bacterium]